MILKGSALMGFMAATRTVAMVEGEEEIVIAKKYTKSKNK